MIKIGNAQAFWGDRNLAAAELVKQVPDLDYLTLDYLAELSLSILAQQRAKDPNLGYARDFITVVETLLPFWKKGYLFKLLTNAGGLNPIGLGEAVRAVVPKSVKVAVVYGDDLLSLLKADPSNPLFSHAETGQPLTDVVDDLVVANAYMGAAPLADALSQGADLVITGRVADPSLVVAPCLAHFGWDRDAYDRLAGATVAGHLIECGTQVTGGISTRWLEIADPAHLGYPVAEIAEDGSCVLTKSAQSTGCVTIDTVKEQLLYELGDPAHYLSPDATVSFLSLQLEEQGKDRIQIRGARGAPPPPTYKVSASYKNGYRSEALLALFGDHLREKGERCAALVFQRLKDQGLEPERTLVECLGCGDLVKGRVTCQPPEAILRLAVADKNRAAVEAFTKEIAPLVTHGPQGVTGYARGRPKVYPEYVFWPCAIARSAVEPKVRNFE